MVGYAFRGRAPLPIRTVGCRQRVFFLLPHDRDSYPGVLYREGAPGEAVDPRTVTPREPGAKTPRSPHGPALTTPAS
ncbi:DUF6009 family protein [Streptomyces sp. NPDC014676]|uniref:DUF6009 family protein n=1 Tax=Streptomyces sp. NPDC014676 TaxID=3364879 RepID=UPI003702F4D7